MRLSPILTFYIGRHFLWTFLAVLAVVMALVLLFDLIELLRRTAGRDDADLFLVIQMALFKMPQMIQMLMPFAVMIGGMIVFWRLTRSHELVVARAAGVSVWQFLAPVMAIVLFAGMMSVTVFNPLSAALYSRYEHLQDNLAIRSQNPLMFSEGGGLWLREARDEKQIVVHAGAARQERRELLMRDVSIFFMEGERFIERVDAAAAQMADGRINMRSVWILVPGSPTEFRETLSLPTALTITKIQDNFASPETLSFWELPSFISFTESTGFSAQKHRLYLQSLLSQPLLLVAMVLVAAAFTLHSNVRSGGVMIRIIGGVGAGFMLFFFSKVVYALGLSSTLPVALAAWSPAVVTTLLGLSSLFHLEDG